MLNTTNYVVNILIGKTPVVIIAIYYILYTSAFYCCFLSPKKEPIENFNEISLKKRKIKTKNFTTQVTKKNQKLK